VSDQRMLRCSDHDRERVAETLRVAAGDGRLTLTELEDRLAAVYSARTYGELEPALADLPAPATSTTPDGSDERISAVLASEVRGGRWDVPRRLEVFASLGSCKLDLTHAVVRHREVVIDARLYLSSLLVFRKPICGHGVRTTSYPRGSTYGLNPAVLSLAGGRCGPAAGLPRAHPSSGSAVAWRCRH
jgi:hypothetical protein